MFTEKKIVNSYTVEITIKDSSESFEKAKEKVLQHLSEHANIKGFRKGAKISEEVLEKHYSKEEILNETIEQMINTVYSKVLKKEGIIPTGPAKLKELKSTKPLEIILEIEILPEITIDEKKISKIKLKKEVIKVEKDEIEGTIKEIEKRFTKFVEVTDGEIAEGDRATVDTIGFEKKGGKEIPETKVKTFPLIIGSGSFIPGFEEKLIGAKAGEVVEFDITFPKDYHSPEFQSRKVYFVTTVFRLEKAIKPEWTEEFIEQLRGSKTDFEGFKKIIEGEIIEEKTYRSKLADETKLLAELEKISKIEIGPNLLANEVQRVYKEHKENLEGQGIDIKHYLDHLKKDEESYIKEAVEPEALRRLKAELLLEKLKEIVKMEVSEIEIKDEIEKILKNYSSPDVREKLIAKLIPGDTYYEDIKNRIRYQKIINTFFE